MLAFLYWLVWQIPFIKSHHALFALIAYIIINVVFNRNQFLKS